jgi:hypothetical protein
VLDGDFAPLETPPGGVFCTDGVKNSDESDVDCGGVCAPCGLERACGSNADCASRLCAQAICAPASCADGMKDGGETDVDCGGPCAGCAEGAGCVEDGDCLGGVCVEGACPPPSCGDGAHNGDELDVDCGGSCGPCGPGKACATDGDCAGGACIGGVCIATCTDAVVNGYETDIDCGGVDCAPCPDGASCSVASDCASDVCSGGVCQIAACSDGVVSGSETDIDCGGPDCAPCANGMACVHFEDCASGACASSVCEPWAKGFGPHVNSPFVAPVLVSADAAGGIAFASSYQASVDFGGGMLPDFLTFLVKFSRTGVHLWSRSVGYVSVHDLASDSSGDVYVVGSGHGDMGCGFYAEEGAGDAMIAKYDGNTGACVWQKYFHTPYHDTVARIAVAPNDDLVVLGWFGVGTFQLDSIALTNDNPPSSNLFRRFLARLDAGGAVSWAKTFADDAFPTDSQGLAVDALDNIAVTAEMSNVDGPGTVDFGSPCTALSPSDMNDVFIAKLDGGGACIWAHAYSGPNADLAHDVTFDASGDMLFVGISDGDIDFGGGALSGLTVAKLTGASGAHVWSRGMQALVYEPARIVSDAVGDAIVVGSFFFDANLGNGLVSNKSSLSSCYACTDFFVAKYAAATGNHLFSTSYGADAPDKAFDLALHPMTGNALVTGSFEQLLDLGAPQPLAPTGPSAFVFSAGPLP